MYIDAHCHLDLPIFDDDRGDVVQRARDAGIEGFVLAGVDAVGWVRQRAVAKNNPGFIWTAGLHPVAASRLSRPEALGQVDELSACFVGEAPAVAVGEMGLDRVFANPDTLPLQREVFRAQLAYARAVDLPCVFHFVRCHGLALEILKKDGVPGRGGVVHSFGGPTEVAEAYLGLGLHLSVCATVMNPRSARLRHAIVSIPDRYLLIESDAPDQSPNRGERNEPAVIIEVAQEVAKLRGCTQEQILRNSATNCAALFDVERW